MSQPRTLIAAGLLAVAAGCGGGSNGGGTPTAPAGPQTNTFSGTASINGTGGCSPGAHTVATGSGSITVTITQASAPRVKLQICATTETDHTQCTVAPFASLAIGESVTAVLKGGRNQSVAVFPEACGAAGSPTATSITYTVSVTYPPG